MPTALPENMRDLFEPDVDVIGKSIEDDEGVLLLWSKQAELFNRQSNYWRELIDRGKTCYDCYNGKIFDDDTRDQYENVEDKICVEPRKMAPALNSLIGELMQGRRSGSIVTEGGTLQKEAPNTDELEVVKMVLKHAEDAWEERLILREAMEAGIISSFISWLWWEPTDEEERDAGKGKYCPTVRPWDSMLPSSFKMRKIDGSDLNGVIYNDYRSDSELIRAYPEQKELIQKWAKDHRGVEREETMRRLFDNIDGWDSQRTSSLKNELHHYLTTGISSTMAPEGYHAVHERVFKLLKDVEVGIDIFNEDAPVIHRPPEWSDERWDMYLERKGEDGGTRYAAGEREVKVLWVTTWTDDGLVLENDLHWFQDGGRLPGCPYVASMVDQKPDSPSVHMLNDMLAIATAETEYLDDIRQQHGRTVIAREGAIENIDDLPTEMTKANGFISLSRRAGPIQEAIQVIEKNPSQVALEYSMKREQDMERATLINKNAMGSLDQPRQSGLAKQIEISRFVIAQSLYVDNFNHFWTSFQNKKLAMLPYAFDEYDVLEVMDEESNQMVGVPINEPVMPEVGDASGDPEAVINDLTSHRYTWKMTPVDDSPSARQREHEEFVIWMNAVPGPLMAADPTGKLLAMLMMSQTNRMIKDAGQSLAEDAKMRQEQLSATEQQKTQLEIQERMEKLRIDAERAKKQGVNLSFTGEQLVEFPVLAEFLSTIGFVESGQAAQQPPTQPTPPDPAMAAA